MTGLTVPRKHQDTENKLLVDREGEVGGRGQRVKGSGRHSLPVMGGEVTAKKGRAQGI